MTNENDIQKLQGGLGWIKGLQTSGVFAGFRKNPDRKDLALIVTTKKARAAGVFTQNRFCAAPVEVSKNHLAQLSAKDSSVRAIMINSGNANATTGEPGLNVAYKSASYLASLLACEPEQVLVASTGVIGVQLPMQPFIDGLPKAIDALSVDDGSNPNGGLAAALAIMTTDTHPKQAAVQFRACQSDGTEIVYHIAGICKGSGMIQPNMATMLAVLATDAMLEQDALELALKEAVSTSFNKVTVDSDTSTNDSVFLIATGGVFGKTINCTCPVFPQFVAALRVLTEDLARQIARDGEGASKLVTVNVSGAASDDDADAVARSVANSPLVKTAIAGHDANWGRIAMAVGKSNAIFDPNNVDIKLMGIPVCASGLPLKFSEDEALELFKSLDEIVIDINLASGDCCATIWTCDFTHDYISINADYRS
ncbi:MAG: bifunctional glutamate N-acetyltransferase/amino-acid acetyltransferase ArgJ [Coriobacteriales bacterium]|jgi:glutamate N-acetyltransferase/amino-acid N-acetyltransferase|nr:bifunctional glutamate N-acetyltransferase/amino-acid acetyltransferase ArgJ [Coriobacteriales bacterium]